MTIGSFLDKKKINEFIKKYNMLQEGDDVVLGLSGGPDSVCLFFVLLELRATYDLKIHAVHINHMIRGEDANEDQSFVESLCAAYDVPVLSKRIDIPALAKVSGRSTEEEARIARYKAFDELSQKLLTDGAKRVRIAIAHNANDNAETVLFHLARGCGLDGVCGIAPCRGNIIRPLLEVPKADIVAFLDENGQDYCIDATNKDVNYDRNRIRHNIIPELCEINDRSLEHISAMTEHLSEIAAFVGLEADGLLAMASTDGDKLRKRTIMTAPKVVKSQAIKQYLSRFMPDEKDVSESHIEAALAMLSEDGEKYIDLPHKKRLVISYETLYVVDTDEDKKESKGHFDIKEIDYKSGMPYPTDTYTKWFDCDKITGDIVIRHRKEGDYLVVNSAGGTKSIQDYFVDSKIPKSERDEVWLACDGSHVLWVVGYRISEHYKITDKTTRVLEIIYSED